MNFQWILLALFLITMILEIAKALTRPMHKNVMNLISIPVAFLIAYILQINHVFQEVAEGVVSSLDFLVASVGEDGVGLLSAILSTMLSPIVFVLIYNLLLFVIRLVHVNLLSKYIESRQMKKEKRLLKIAIKQEKELVKKAIIESEERAISIMEALEEQGLDYGDIVDYEPMDEDEIEDMVEKRVRKERRVKKKLGFFKESSEKRAVSFITAAVSGFLAFAIFMMPVFYTMDVLADMSDGIDRANRQDNKIYLAMEFFDKHIIDQYEGTFIYEIYDSMGLIDLMIGTVKAGGVIELNGETTTADRFVRDILGHTVTVVTQIMSPNPNAEALREALNGIIQQPVLFSILVNNISSIMEDVEVPEASDEEDILESIKNNILRHYKKPAEPQQDQFATEDEYQLALEQYKNDVAAYEEMLKGDVGSLTDVIVTLVEQKLLIKLVSQEQSIDEILSDKDNIKDLLGAMSGLSVYDIVISGAFIAGVDMLAPMLGVPADNAAGYVLFRDQIISSFESVKHMDDELLSDFSALLEGASEFDNIYAYIEDPTNKLKALKNEAEKIKQKIQNNADAINAMKSDIGSFTPEQQEAWEALIAEETKLADEAKALGDKINEQIDIFKERIPQLMSFISYYWNWMSVQKPFMLAAEDDSLAALTMKVNGTNYLINTDDISIETLIDVLFKDTTEEEPTTPDEGTDPEPDPDAGSEPDPDPDPDAGSEPTPTPGSGEAADDIPDIDLDALLAEIPFSDLLKTLAVTNDAQTIDAKESPIADLINYLIRESSTHKSNESAPAIDLAWLESKLGSFEAESGSDCEKLVNKILAVDDESEESMKQFEYLSVTVEQIKESLRFDLDTNCTHEEADCECWTAERKENDSKNLVEVIFTLVDSMKDLGGDLTPEEEAPSTEEPVLTSDTTVDEDPTTEEDDENEDSSGVSKILDMLKGLGTTFDLMAETHSLAELPGKMVEGLLKNEMLSMVMTPSTLGGYMNDLDKIKAGELTYEQFMSDFAETISNLLDKLNEAGGVTE